MNRLLEGELQKFNEWFMWKQKEKGITDPAPLMGIERGAIISYLVFAATDRGDEPYITE